MAGSLHYTVMMVDLQEVCRIATEVADQTPWLEVLGVVGAAGGSGHVELLISLLDCPVEPCRLLLSLNRAVSPDALRKEIAEKLTNASATLLR